jgi:hypothetical protein
MTIYNDLSIKDSKPVFDLVSIEKGASYESCFKNSRAAELGGLSMSDRKVHLGGLSDAESKSAAAKVDEASAGFEKLVLEQKYSVGPGLDRRIEVSFNQDKIYKNKTLPVPLEKIVMRFNGLCDLICNKILIEGLMEFEDVNGFNHLKDSITKESLNDPVLLSSHILDIYSLREKLAAFFFGKYADSIFGYLDQLKLVKKDKKGNRVVNGLILQKGLKDIENGSMLKVEIIRKTFLTFTGHSLLIKKIDNNNYVLFDPNLGLFRPVPLEGLVTLLNDQLEDCKGNEIHIVKGSTFLERLRQKRVFMLAQKAQVAPR